MTNFITARSTSPLSDPSGREARVTSAFESPLSDLNGREASLIAERKSPLSDPNGREASLIAERKRPLSDPNGREASLIAESKNPLSAKHSSHCREVSLTAATQCFPINTNMSKTEISSQGALNFVSKQIPENPFIAVSTQAAALKPATVSTKDAVQPIPFSYSKNNSDNCKDEKKNKNHVKIKKDSIGITKIQEKIKKDCIAITKSNEKIKKDSIGITKINEKIKKDSMGITKTDEKMKKDSVGITKTHEKIIKSKKYVKKRKIKSRSMIIISRNEIRKNQKL